MRKIEEKKKVVESKFQEQMESMKVKMKEKVDTEEIERRLEDRVRKIEEKKKAMESKFQEQMERMEAKMKENEDKEERLKAEKEQSEKEESRKEMEEKVRHSNKQLKYTNIDLGGRVTSRKAIVERFIWLMREASRQEETGHSAQEDKGSCARKGGRPEVYREGFTGGCLYCATVAGM